MTGEGSKFWITAEKEGDGQGEEAVNDFFLE